MKKIIIDTDLGGDCDDVGALAVACNLAKRGDAELLAVTYCIGNPWGGYFTRHELDYFGFGKVPLGVLKDESFMTDPGYSRYSRPICESWKIPTPDFDDAVKVLRRALSENSDVTLIAIGPLRNIANLLDSKPDEISPLTGVELVKKSVRGFVTMLGSFRPDFTEWNVEMDIPSARKTVEKMPVPIIFSPFELGNHIKTGNLLKSLPETHPVREAYRFYTNGGFLRPSWDLITVYFAITDSNIWNLRETFVNIDEKGRFAESTGSGMFALEQNADDAGIVKILDELMK